MNYTISHGTRSGTVSVPSSKSYAHRFLISAALADKQTTVVCHGISKDISATIRCLESLGAEIAVSGSGKIEVTPIAGELSGMRHLYCGESGSTLRFILPIACALGVNAVFHTEGGLSERPMSALTEELSRHGAKIRKEGSLIISEGQLLCGDYSVPGNVSSQFISGLLFALPLLSGASSLTVEGKTESADYIKITEDVLNRSSITLNKDGSGYKIQGNQKYTPKNEVWVERDWSNAAFFICMGATSPRGIELKEMSSDSIQGDRAVLEIIRRFGAEVVEKDGCVTVRRNNLCGYKIDASAIPDLVPTLCALAAGAEGRTEITNAGRLRFKESDRLKTTADMLKALGADVNELPEGLVINGKKTLCGGTVDAANDHRIAMAAAVAACVCSEDVTVKGAECVEKSYPDFWRHLEMLEVSK